jgi:chromosome segregation ATPase
MTEIDEEVLDRLEAEAKVAEADVEELTIAVESDIESTESEVEELQEEVAEKKSEVEELQSELEEKEEKVEEMNEKMESVADTYAEELAKHNDVLDKEDFLGKFEFEELQEKYEDLEDSSPAPNSGDPGAGFQSPDNGGEGGDGGEPEELSNKAKVASEQFERRGGVWKDVAEDIEENGLGEVRKRGDGEEVFA